MILFNIKPLFALSFSNNDSIQYLIICLHYPLAQMILFNIKHLFALSFSTNDSIQY